MISGGAPLPYIPVRVIALDTFLWPLIRPWRTCHSAISRIALLFPHLPQYSWYWEQPLLAYFPCCLMLSCGLLPRAVSVWVIKVHDKKFQAMLSKMYQWFVCSTNMISCSWAGCRNKICSTFSTLQHASLYQCVQNSVNRAKKNMHICVSGGPNCLRVQK